MTKSPSLVLTVLGSLLFFSAGTPSEAATTKSSKSSKSTSKQSTTTAKKSDSSTSKTVASTKSSTTSKPAPKAQAVSAAEIQKATSTTAAAATAAASSQPTSETKEKEVANTEGATSAKDKAPGTEGGPQTAAEKKKPAAVSTMAPEDLVGFEAYHPTMQEVVRKALDLTTQNLRYQFGSADPKNGGMDCSGTMCHVLQSAGIKGVPRQSDEICRWVMRRSVLYRTENITSLKNAAFTALHPGDLLFWTGTYDTGGQREIPISHVMMYLGKRKKDGKHIVFGSSDGRTYNGERRNGVSVFDFSLPQRGGKAAFYGYGPIPGIPKEEIRPAIVRAVPAYAAQ